MPHRFHTAAWFLLLPLALCSAIASAADAPKVESKTDESKSEKAEEAKVIKPEEAKDHLDKVVTVEFTVVKSRELLDKNIAFLNSETDLKSPKNFTAYIRNAKKFKEASKIEKPTDHYLKKKVRVTGKVIKYQEKLEIEVESPDQIKIVEDPKPEETKSKDSTKAE
jgi:DNA/RNA endonuclease YhcR with UshA esterase domain